MTSFKGSNSQSNQSIQRALQPTNFYSPYGSVTSAGNSVYFQPNATETDRQIQSAQSGKILDAINSLPTVYDVNAAFNNPFYQSTQALLTAPLIERKAQEVTGLNNDLNAKNQIGSSFDAYSKDLLNRRYDQQFNQADLEARQASSDAYNQQIGNTLSVLRGLRNDQSQAQENALEPIRLASQYQSTLTPLSTTFANISGQQALQNQRIQSSYFQPPSIRFGF
ncbi:MAG: hypothetical protein K2X66_13275 [Cyanobacteria bacterium]|nr:hypothetical protein [Cyanobacteriota bacterium]